MGIGLELSGLTDEFGGVGREVPLGYLLIPGTIELEKYTDALGEEDSKRLTWCIEPGSRIRRVQPSRAILDDFLALTEVPKTKAADAVLSYARKYGVLRINHRDEVGAENFAGKEPIYRWLDISRRAAAVINIVAAQRRDERELGSEADWLCIRPFSDPSFPKISDFLPHGSAAARLAIEREINAWLTFGRVGLGVSYEANCWKSEITYGAGLFAAIGLQLLLVATGADSLFNCAWCRKFYSRPAEMKRPNPGQDNFCPECQRTGKPLQAADRRRRERDRSNRAEALKLHVSGLSKAEITKHLGLTNSKKLDRWLDARRPPGL